MSTEVKEAEKIALYGQTKTFIGPSGKEYTIQEQNGEHDAMLSNVGKSISGDNYDHFIANIVIKTNFTQGGRLSIKDVQNLPALDFAYILLQSRLHSLGAEIKFFFEWEAGKPTRYSEDLTPYLPDYTMDQDELDDLLLRNKLACPYYPAKDKTMVEFTTSSQRKYRFSIATRAIEKKMLEIPQDNLDINTKLKIRLLEMQYEGDWVKVDNFGRIKSKEMREIRGYLDKYDPSFNAISELTNPANGQKQVISLLELPDFFFPAEI